MGRWLVAVVICLAGCARDAVFEPADGGAWTNPDVGKPIGALIGWPGNAAYGEPCSAGDAFNASISQFCGRIDKALSPPYAFEACGPAYNPCPGGCTIVFTAIHGTVTSVTSDCVQ